MQSNITNRFDPKKTKTVLIHDGRFHTDDMMFAAMAIVAAEKFHNKITVKRISVVPEEYDETIIVGDIGLGIYDHHTNKETALGVKDIKEGEHIPAACGLLYHDLKDILFEGESETKELFEHLINIIEHCDNTSDNNTFSDSVNYLFPAQEDLVEQMAVKAMQYCKAVVKGFVEAHKKEKTGKLWAIPKTGSRIAPGCKEKEEERYWNSNYQTKQKYNYISFNEDREIKIKSIDTYGMAMSVMPFKQREHWRELIEETDRNSIKELERREAEDWPIAKMNQKNKTIVLDHYMQWGKFIKEIDAVFIVLPSQRGGWTVNPIKTMNGLFRCDPDKLLDFEGCDFVANDKRFVLFDTKEHAVAAAESLGKEINRYIINNGFEAYREIYGGIRDNLENKTVQKLLGEDIALNMFVTHTVLDIDKLSVAEFQKIRIACTDNQDLIHSFCCHFKQDGDVMYWKKDVKIMDAYNQNGYLKKLPSGSPWDFGLTQYINKEGISVLASVFPKIAQAMVEGM